MNELEPAEEPGRHPDGAPSVLSELVLHLRSRVRLLVLLPLAGAAGGILLAFVLPSWYTARASFVPEQSQTAKLPAGLGGLAGQLGLNLGADGSQSPRFYAQLMTSRVVLAQVLQERAARGASGTDSARILELVGGGGRSAADSIERSLKRLTKQISTEIDPKSSIISVAVEARSATLAARIADLVLSHMVDFNARSRQTQAHRRRLFLEGRVRSAGAELETAEGRLTAFYRDNRSFSAAPGLRALEARLQREVQVAQEVYLTLQRSYETARIDEVNDVPALTVIDAPVVPARRTRPVIWLLGLVGAALGGALAGVLAVAPAFRTVLPGGETVARD